MAKTVKVKARKDYKCGRCNKEIKKGEEYLRCEPAYMPTVIRCTRCGVQFWETTTSDYIQRMGKLQATWEDEYGVSPDTIDSIRSEVEEMKEELEGRLENMPEGLQQGDVGQTLQSRIDSLETVLSDLDSVDTTDYDNAAESVDDLEDIDEDVIQSLADEINAALDNIEF